MLWVILALIGALANASFYILVRKYVTLLDPRILTALGFLLGGTLLLAISALRGFPLVGPGYYGAVIASACLNIIGLSLVFRAMASSDLSLSMPMLSFTPVFLISTSYLLLHEIPSPAGIAGICVIVSGSYVLNISSGHEYFFDPVKSMIGNRGSWYMLIVAFLFAVSINYDKIAMLNSDPVFGMAFTLLVISSILFLIPSISEKIGERLPCRDTAHNPDACSHLPGAGVSGSPYLVPAILIAVFAAAESVSINIAYTLQIAPYVIAIKRLSIIFMVLYGILVCAESELRTRFVGSALMVGGAVIILLYT